MNWLVDFKSMKTYLLELKVKDTESIDWKKGLSSYLRRSYGSGQWSQFYDENLTDEFDRLRHNANGELACEALLEQNLLYYAYLEHLHLRLGNNSAQLKLEFTWYDAEYGSYNKAQKYSQRTLALEKSCTLYNIGVLYTQVAKEKLSDDYKKSIGCLSKATACFEYLSENFLNSPSTDLLSSNTKFLQNMCFSEGQELFLQKLINGATPSKQASLISKLAYATVCLYGDCCAFYKEGDDSSATVPTYGELKWRYIIDCKHSFYKSVASYYYGLFLEQQNKFGEAIAFLKLASSSLDQSLIHKIYLKDFIDFKGFKEQIEEKEKQLIKDNDYIYHETIPQSVQLETIKQMNAIKPVSWPDQIEPFMNQVGSKCEILYKGIVPMEIYEKESIYSEEKASLVRQQMDANETANWEYNSFLEFTNLPKLIIDIEKRCSNGFQESNDPEVEHMKERVALWANVVQNSKFKDLDEQMKMIVSKRQKISNTMSALPADQKDNILKMKSALIEASQSDERLFSLVRPHTEEIKLLSNNSLLWKNFNDFDVESTSQPSLLDMDDFKTEKIAAQLKSLKQKAEDLRLLKEERSRNLEELKEETSKDDITNVLLVNRSKSDSELKAIFESQLGKFKPFSNRIEAAVRKQTTLINEMKILIDDIFNLSGIQDKSVEATKNAESRKRFFEKLQEAIGNFNIFCADIPKGLAFYDSLLHMAEDLLSKSRDNTHVSNTLPPPLPQHPEMTAQLSDLYISPTPAPPPIVPPRTYGDVSVSQPASAADHFGNSSNFAYAPPVPPKKAPTYGSGPFFNKKDVETEERELQQNPTSFYSRPSVFDENLYSKFSG